MYNIKEFSMLSGVSPRTLRHYEDLGLLNPSRGENGYRIYGDTEVSTLQLILFYKELGFQLSSVKEILTGEDFDMENSLKEQLESLEQKRNQLDGLIENVHNTLKSMRGEIKMTDKDKFEAFKKNLVAENERKYGDEVREMYGEELVNYANNRILGMTKDEHKAIEELSAKLNETLKKATEIGDPNSDLAKEAVELHRKWMGFFMKDSDCEEAQIGMSEMYVNDGRFKAYYDNILEGSAEFLRDAVRSYYNK